MKKLILMLCMLLLLCSCVDGATKIGLDRLNWSQQLPISDTVDVKSKIVVGNYYDYNAKLYDYITYNNSNDIVTIQSALNDAYNVSSGPINSQKAIVELQPGFYQLAGSTTLTIPFGVTLSGAVDPSNAICSAVDGWYKEGYNQGFATILVYNSVTPAITAYGLGCTISDLAFFYPLQKRNSTPDVYPATIYANVGELHLKNIWAGNSYIFCDSTGVTSSTNAYNIFGYPLKAGFIVDNGYSLTYYEKIKFHPGYMPGYMGVLPAGPNSAGIMAYTEDNGVGLDIRRSDAVVVSRCEISGYNVALKLTGTNDSTISQFYSESVRPIWIEKTLNTKICNFDISTSIYTARPFTHDANGITIVGPSIWATPETAAVISNGAIRLCQAHGVYIDSVNPVMISNVFFDIFGLYTASSSGVEIVSGYGHSVMDCNFFGIGQGDNGVVVRSPAQSCRVEGNNIQNCTYSTVWTDSVGSIIIGNRLFGQNVTGDAGTNTIANNRYTPV